MVKLAKNEVVYFRHAVGFFAYLFVVWGFYRLLFQAPEPLEELIVKPLVWIVPTYYLLKKEKENLKSIGFQFENFFGVVYFVLMLGFIFSAFAFVVNYLKYDGFNFAANIGQTGFVWALVLSFFTAISEEVAFRGFIFTRLNKVIKNQWSANLIASIGWTMIHLPIALFDWKLPVMSLVVYILMVFTFSFGATFVFIRTKNIVAPILLHVLWQWPIILFR